MANDLKLEVGIRVNDAETDAAISRMRQKLSEITKMTGAGQQNSPSAQNIQNNQSRVLQDMQKRYLDDMLKQYDKIKSAMADIDKMYQSQNTSEKEKIKQQEKYLQLKKQEQELAKGIGQAGGGPQPPQPPQTPGGGDQNSVTNAITSLLKGVSASAIINGALNISQNMIKAEGRGQIATGQVAAASSEGLRAGFQGRGLESVFFGRERMTGLQMAQRQMEAQSPLDLLKVAGSAAIGGIGGGALAGTAVMPGVGTAVGAIGGAIGGFGTAMLSDRNMAAVFDRDRYRRMLTAEGMKNAREFEAAERAKNPLKSLAFDFLQNNQEGLLSATRMTGMADSETLLDKLRGSMTFGGNKFGMQDVMGAMGGMQSAGARTRDLQGELPGLAVSAQQYGVTNAASILGRISGAGGPGETDDKFQRIMSLAVKNGINISDMPQELNKFATVAADLATRGGGFSAGAAEIFGAGMTDFSQSNIRGAQAFAEDYAQRAGAAGGLEAQVGYGFLQSGAATEAFGGREAMQKMRSSGLTRQIQNITSEELDRDPALARYLASQMGISVDQLKAGIRKKDVSKQATTARSSKALESLGGLIQGKSAQEAMALLETEEGTKAYGEAFTALRDARGADFKPGEDARSTVLGLARLTQGESALTPDQLAESMKVREARAGTFEDVRRAGATGDVMQVGNLKDNLTAVSDSAKTFTESSAKFAAAFQVMTDSIGKAPEAMEKFVDAMSNALKVIEEGTPMSGNMPMPTGPATRGR